MHHCSVQRIVKHRYRTSIDSWVSDQAAPSIPPQRTTGRNPGKRRDCASLAGRTAAALPTNEQLVNTDLEVAKADVLAKGKVHQEALKELDKFESEKCTTFEDFFI